MTDLSKIGSRNGLKPQKGDEPHWHRLSARSYLGFRPSKRRGDGRGTWLARAYDKDARRYRQKALGDYSAYTGDEVFKQAKRDAEQWAEAVETGAHQSDSAAVKVETIADACRAYLGKKPERTSELPAEGLLKWQIANGVFRRHVFDDPIAKVKLDKLRRHHLKEWRERLEARPALTTRKTGARLAEAQAAGELLTKPRSSSTVNRDMVPLRAALMRYKQPGAPGTDAAWQEALKPVRGADRRRGLYLDQGERKQLLEAADAEVEPFLRALCLLPLRPGAIAGLTAGAFDKRTSTLTIGKDKAGNGRQIAVPQVLASFLTEQAKDKLPGAPMFTRADGRAWSKDAWKKPLKDAASAAKLHMCADGKSAVSAYTLRHSVITDLVRNGLPVLTVAQLSGTSVAMIERHYGHLVRNDAVEALARLAI